MRIAVTGATGFIGSGLSAHLASAGHDVVALGRGDEAPRWDPERPVFGAGGPVDAVVHLAGEPMDERWTKKKRAKIRQSRVEATENLCRALAALPSPPQVLVSTSAVGFYGHTGDREVDETGMPGDGFLAEICQGWEAAVQPAREAGIRVVQPRFGMVLHPEGGALGRMLLPFRLGVGGPVGDGQQFFAWVHYNDLTRAVEHLLESDLEGPVNIVAPEEVRFRGFAKALGKALHRPAVMPLPAPAVRLVFGQMGQEMLLQGQRVVPKRLASDGFQWEHPGIEDALEDLLSATP